MKKTIILFSSFVAIMAALIIAYKADARPVEKLKTEIQKKEDTVNHIKRGEYLVSSMGCDDCHSPKKMGPKGPEIIPELRFSGYPSKRPLQKANTQAIKDGWVLFNGDLTTAVGEWGESFAANITSDATGIGNWTEDQFLRAIREGKLKGLEGSRPILPPMPWFAYRNLTDSDLKDIFAFLKSTTPVENVVPAPIAPTDL